MEVIDNRTWDGCENFDRNVMQVLEVIFDDTKLTSIFWILTFLTLLMAFAYTESIHYVVNNIPNKERKLRIIWILGIYPMFATTSLLALYFPRSAIFCNLTAVLYYALGVYLFLDLVAFFFGGYEQAILKVADTQVRLLPCLEKPSIKTNEWSFMRMRHGINQFAALRVATMFIESVLLTNGFYNTTEMNAENGSLIIYCLVLVSGIIFLCTFYIAHNACKPHLKGYFLTPKFLIIAVGFLISDLQMFILALLATQGKIPCVVPFDGLSRASSWYSFVQIIECSILFPVVQFFFRTRKGNLVSKIGMAKVGQTSTQPKKKKPLLRGSTKTNLYNSYTNL